MYKHFVGATSPEDLKKRYRKLAFEHHPDKGGNESIFKEVVAEYNRILDGVVTYPITNINQKQTVYSSIEDMFREAARQYAEQTKAYQRQQYQNAGQAYYERNRQAREKQENPILNRWEKFKTVNSMTAQIVDSVVVQTLNQGKTGNWLLAELYKLDHLTLDVFEYVKFKIDSKPDHRFKMASEWHKDAYKNYVSFKSIKWVDDPDNYDF